MHAWPERRPLRRIWHSRDNQRAAGRATDCQTPMALNQRPDRGKLNLVVLADGFGSKIARQAGAAAKTLVGMMIMTRSASSLMARL